MKITSRGFQFLLNSPHAQLWELLLHYLSLVDQRNMDLVEVLSFLFMLSTMELGQEYTGENLTGTQLVMLEDLRDYGLIYQRPVSPISSVYIILALTLRRPKQLSCVSFQRD